MHCPNCDQSRFRFVHCTVVAAEDDSDHGHSPDTALGPSMQCVSCGLLYVNYGTHIEAEPTLLPAA
jgi:hypothetical protein